MGNVRVVLTRGVNDAVATDAKFAKFMLASLQRFNHADWGDSCAEDSKLNNADLRSLKQGLYGRILASYTSNLPFLTAQENIWIVREIVEADGTQAITVLFPSEY